MSAYQELKHFLEQDPDNTALRLDCADAAIAEDAFDDAMTLLVPLAEKGEPKAIGLMGLIDLRKGEHEAAAKTFGMLMDGGIDDPGLRFNLAWSLAHLKRFEDALEVLTDDAARSLPQGAMLRVQLLHQLERFEDAADMARAYVELFPDYPGLLAAASTIAMDTDDAEWAQELAARAPDHPEAKVTLATLNLSRENAADASAMFDEVLAVRPDAARALIGKGLSQILMGDPEAASISLDKGAESFGTHLGSWIAAGWSYAVRGDYETALSRFNQALSIDDTFAETHGSIGVIDILQDRADEGQKRIRTARRLDPECASAALGQVLLLQGQGRSDAAQQIFERAMNTPIDGSGKTLSQAMIDLGMS